MTPAELQLRAKARLRLKQKSALEIGQGMPEAPDRIAQAFDVASDPIADQSLRPDYNQYGFTENMMRSLPFGDEVGSGGAALGRYLAGQSGFDTEVGLGEQYERQRTLDRAEQERYARQNPVANVGGQVLGVAAGGAPTGAAAAFGTLRQTPAVIAATRSSPAAVPVAATVPGRIAQGVRQSAPLGALYGAGEGEGIKERAVNTATGAATAAALGTALPLAGAALRSARRLYGGYDPEIGGHVQRLRQEANNLYTQMDQAGVQLSQPTFLRMAHNINARAHAEGLDPNKHRAVQTVLNSLVEEASGRGAHNVGRVPTLRRMDQLRQDLRDAGETRSERRIARIMTQAWDEQLNRLNPRDLTAGNPRAGMTALREARRLRQQFYKAESVDEILENARDAVGANYTQAGLQTAIRQQFRALNKRIRKGQEPGWSNEERRLINLIVRGGSGENFMRLVGRLAVRGPVSGSMSALTGYFVNPALGVGMAGAGELTKRASTARGIMNVEALDRLLATGNAAAPQRQLGPGSQALGQLRRFLVQQGAGWSGKGGLGDRLTSGE
jgi:hypothetical protein